jgi:hypothetical protein
LYYHTFSGKEQFSFLSREYAFFIGQTTLKIGFTHKKGLYERGLLNELGYNEDHIVLPKINIRLANPSHFFD